jgi:predicted transcriptional regulator
MTVEELKAEVAKLSSEHRFALAEWLEGSEDVRALRHDLLVREIEEGIRQADAGELIDGDEVFARLRAAI